MDKKDCGVSCPRLTGYELLYWLSTVVIAQVSNLHPMEMSCGLSVDFVDFEFELVEIAQASNFETDWYLLNLFCIGAEYLRAYFDLGHWRNFEVLSCVG